LLALFRPTLSFASRPRKTSSNQRPPASICSYG
jgi:hypothetical protein